MSKLVTIVLPVYNHADYLPAALDSIFAQTYKNFELIVVNDGSTDATPQVLEEYQEKYDFRVIHQRNKKLPQTLNRGFSEAKGEYLTWTSSDNLMEPNMLARLVKAMEANPEVGLVYADYYVITDDNRNLGRQSMPEYDFNLLMHTNFVHCCFMYRRECRERIGGYDPRFLYGEDWEYWIRISKHFRLLHLPEVLYRYRVHGQSMTAEIMRGTAKSMSARQFSRYLQQQQPIRWWIGKLKWFSLQHMHMDHPILKQRRAWLKLTQESVR